MLGNPRHFGNPRDPVGDHCYVDCTQCKEFFSARLDSEDSEVEREAIDTHFMICAACRWFAEGAARVTRLARTAVASEEPDLVEVVLAAAHPSPRPPLRRIFDTSQTPDAESRLVFRIGSDPRVRSGQPHLSDIRSALEAARFCGCTCCRRWTGLLSPSG